MAAKKKKSDSQKARQQKNQTKPQDQFDALHTVAFWGLALLLFFPPYFRGLFFAPEQEKALIFATLVFWLTFLWRWLQNDHKFLRGPLDWFALALPLMYIISSFTAVNKGLAIDEIVKNVLYFLTYWSVSRLIRDEEDIHKLLHVIYVSAIGVALAGLATTTEIIHIKDGFLDGRIYSSFQYPNALASYLAAVSLIGMYLWHRAEDLTVKSKLAGQSAPNVSLPGGFLRSNPWGYFYACGNFIVFAVLLGTKSRGGLLIYGLVLLFYIVGLTARGRLLIALHAGINIFVAYICTTKFISLSIEKYYNQAWLWILAGILLICLFQFIFRFIEERIFVKWDQSRKYDTVLGSLFALGVMGGGIVLTTQQTLMQKLLSFSFLQNAFERMYFVEDAVKMFKEKPLLGWGGGGWEEAYRSFQNYLYNSNEVHSYYFQVGVETGLPGLVAVAGIWLSFILLIIKLLRNNKENPDQKQLILVLAAAFLMIGGHALIDFDLSLSALTIILWSIFGITAGMAHHETLKGRSNTTITSKKSNQFETRGKPLLIITSLVTVVIALATFNLVLANGYYQKAQLYLQSQKIEEARIHLEKAVSHNPFNAGYYVTLSQIYRAVGDNKSSIAKAERAVELSPNNASRWFNLAQVCHAAGKQDLAIKHAEKTLELAPYQQYWYDQLSLQYTLSAYAMLEQGEKEIARQYMQKALAMPAKVQSVMDSLSDKYKKMWRDGPPLTANDMILFSAGSAHYQLGQFQQAQEKLSMSIQSQNKEIKGRSLVMLALVALKTGQDNSKVEEYLKQAQTFLPNAREIFNYINSLPLL